MATMATEPMVMTVLEAHVPPDRWAILRQTFAERSAGPLPAQMVRTYLVQSTTDPTLWRAISVWRSRAALEDYRRTVQTPGGVLMFRAAGAEPTLSILEVAVHAP